MTYENTNGIGLKYHIDLIEYFTKLLCKKNEIQVSLRFSICNLFHVN